MIHCVQQLVFVGKVAQDEVDKTEGKNPGPTLEYAVDDAYYVDQDWLWKEEAILEYGGLLEFFVICQNVKTNPLGTPGNHIPAVPRGVFAPNLVIGYNVTEPTCRSLNGYIPSP